MESQPHAPTSGPHDDPLPGFVDRSLPDRFCDLVLTGGVTSSIAYPGAIFALGSVFRFNGIGGSSSGGGAAALAAAAEYRRRHGSPDGFRQMLAGSAAVAECTQGRTGLDWLFQPDRGHERLFEVLVQGVSPPARKGSALLKAAIRAYGPFVLGPGLVAPGLAYLALENLAAAQGPWRLCGVLLLVLGVLAGLILAGLVLWADLRRLAAADHGLCSGLARQPLAPREPITPWLHGLIQQVAGRAPGQPPLTFDDLHTAPGGPAAAGAVAAPSIDLRMFSADVTRGLSLKLPLDDPEPEPATDATEPDATALYFLPHELAALFPADVMAHLEAVSLPAPAGRLVVAGGDDAPPLSAFRRLPGRQLPVIVAARMTVSFPVLFRAVPLWVINPAKGRRRAQLRRCLFADGGLISAFPMHLFDSLLPAWPTFGIALHPLDEADAASLKPGEVGRAEVVCRADDLGPERWETPPTRPRRATEFFDFAGAMLSTLMSWNDNAMRRMAGVRDRIAHISLAPGIGGLNIRMKPHEIRGLARLGGDAGLKLLQRFVLDLSPGGQARGWSEHRWTRFVLLAQSLGRAAEGLNWSARQAPHAEPLARQIERAQHEPPLAHRARQRRRRRVTLLAHEAAALQGLLDALQAAEPALQRAAGPLPGAPGPTPELRQRPPL
jgi:predicted acylesterase/phospholipase RssA